MTNYYGNGSLPKMDILYSNQKSGWEATRRNTGFCKPVTSKNPVEPILDKKKLSLTSKSTLTVQEEEINMLARFTIGSAYSRYEFIQLEIRKILGNSSTNGVIRMCDVARCGLSYYDAMRYLYKLRDANLLYYVQPMLNGTAAKIAVNPDAKSFLTDTIFSRAAVQAVKNRNPLRYYFDVTLTDQIVGVNLHLDVMWLMRDSYGRDSLHFAHVFPSPNLMRNEKALNKLVAMNDRLRSNFTAIVSPSVNPIALRNYVDMHKDPKTSSIRVVQLHQLHLL